MKNLLVVFLIGIMMSMSSVVFASEWNTTTAIMAMQDRAFQLDQQYQICKKQYDSAQEIKECYSDCRAGYDAFIEYMTTEDEQDPIFSACLETALSELWISHKNTTDWFVVMGMSVMCYMEVME